MIVYSGILIWLTPAAMAELFGGSPLLYRATAGAVSGFASGLATDRDPGAAFGQGMLNAGISVINPFGYATFMSPGMQSAFSTGLSNAMSQAASNGEINWVTVFASGAMRYGFGYAIGGASVSSLGSAWSTGMANGFFSSSIKSTGGW
jgi:hypothetical protein